MKNVLVAILMMSPGVYANTVEMPRGPAPSVSVVRDYNLYDIYVNPPPKSASYTPGVVSVYLSKDNPDFMRVPLATDTLPDGQLHARINIDPSKESTYFVYVYDQQPNQGSQLLLLARKLNDFVSPRKKTPNKPLQPIAPKDGAPVER
jgi:hypothetical protein